MHTDPLADMLTRIRNASRARLERVETSFSRSKEALVRILKSEGFIEDFRAVAGKTTGQGIIEIKLRYDQNRLPVICGIKRVSKPGVRLYMGCDEIPRVRNGLGVMILTTPKGVMTDREARKQRVGGEALCAVW